MKKVKVTFIVNVVVNLRRFVIQTCPLYISSILKERKLKKYWWILPIIILIISLVRFLGSSAFDAFSYYINDKVCPPVLYAAKCEKWSLENGEDPRTYFFVYMRFRSLSPFKVKEIYPEAVVISDLKHKAKPVTMELVDGLRNNYKDISLPHIQEKAEIFRYSAKSKFFQSNWADSVDRGDGKMKAPKKFPLLNERLFSYPFCPTLASHTDRIMIFQLEESKNRDPNEGFYPDDIQDPFEIPWYCTFKLVGENVPNRWFVYDNSKSLYPFGLLDKTPKVKPDKLVQYTMYTIVSKWNDIDPTNFDSERPTNTEFIGPVVEDFKALQNEFPEEKIYLLYSNIFESIQNDNPWSFQFSETGAALNSLNDEQLSTLLAYVLPLKYLNGTSGAIFNTIIDQGIKKYPYDIKLINYNGLNYIYYGKFKRAIEEFDKISYNKNPRMFYVAQHNKAFALLLSRKPEKSNLIINELLTKPGFDKNALHSMIACNYIQMKKQDKAEEEYKKISLKSPYYKPWDSFLDEATSAKWAFYFLDE